MSFPPQTGFLTSRLYPFINKSVSIRDGTCKKVSFAVTAKVDQRLCFRHLDSLCFLNPTFRVIFCDCTAWFVSDLDTMVSYRSIFHAVCDNEGGSPEIADYWYKGTSVEMSLLFALSLIFAHEPFLICKWVLKIVICYVIFVLTQITVHTTDQYLTLM